MEGDSIDRESDVYDILVKIAGATDDENNRSQWHHFWNERDQYHEYRFIGSLGFGGKFYCDGRGAGWRVDCYPEHATPLRQTIIQNTNSALATLEADETGKASSDAPRLTRFETQ